MTDTGRGWLTTSPTLPPSSASTWPCPSWQQWPENIISNLGSGQNRFIRKLPNLRPTSSVSPEVCPVIIDHMLGMMELFGISNRSIVDRIISNLPWHGQRTPPGPYWWTGKIRKEKETINDGTWSGWVSSAMIRCANSGGWAEWMSLPKLRRGGGWQRDRYIKEEHTHLDYSPIVHLISRLAGDVTTTKGRSRRGHTTIYSPI